MEYEYDDFVIMYEPGHYYTEYSDLAVRADLWQNLQSDLLPRIQVYLDKGWEAITEIGPAAFALKHFKKWDGKRAVLTTLFSAGVLLPAAPFFKFNCTEPTEFRVKMRRRTKAKSKPRK